LAIRGHLVFLQVPSLPHVRIFILFVAFLLAMPVFAQTGTGKATPLELFSVKGKEVSTEEFLYLFRKNHPKKEDYTEAKVNEYMDLLITFKTKVAEAIRRGYDTTRTFSREFATYRGELKKPYLAGKDQLDRLTQEAYERMKVEVRASHILLSLKPGATPADTLAAYNMIIGFRERALQGEDFASLARQFSTDASTKANGGDLGYFTVMQMVYPFEEAAYRLKTGELSYPVRTRFGYHLVKVTDRRIARGEVEVSHIILRTGTSDDKKVKAKIFEIYNQLQGGRSWDELCKEYSDDQATRNTGGRLRPFGVGALAGVPEFERAAFSLHEPGELTDPFQSAYGWHIVRLERRIPVPPFEQVEESLRKRVSRDERLQVADEQAFAGKLKAFGYVEQQEAKNYLISIADSTLQRGTWRFRGAAEWQPKPLFSLRGQSFTIAQFVAYATREQNPSAGSPDAVMNQLIDAFVRKSLEDIEEEDILRENSEYRNLVQEYREGILLFTIMEKEVWNRASEDTVGLRSFYESNKTKYTAGDRVRARVLATDDSVFIERIRQKLAAGDSLKREEVRKFKSAQGPRTFAVGESKAVDGAPKSIGTHITRIDATYYLVQIDNLVAPGIRSLDEIRSQVISDYQEKLEKDWVKSLRTKYPTRVNSKGKKFVMRELTQP
jgi:peptidyl-prolyl cis-trans isomerase SurA